MAGILSGSFYGPCGGGQKPKSLVVFLHGYGANADDLIPLSYTWGPHLPDTLFLSLNAPALHPSTTLGRQWFPLEDFDFARIWEDMAALTPVLKASIDQQLANHQLSYNNVALVGFSQGAMIALQQSLYLGDVAGAISYSGFLVPHPQGVALKKKPTLLIHGDYDTVLPISCLNDAQKILKEASVPFEAWVCEGLGHGISPFGLEKGRLFLQRILKSSGSRG